MTAFRRDFATILGSRDASRRGWIVLVREALDFPMPPADAGYEWAEIEGPFIGKTATLYVFEVAGHLIALATVDAQRIEEVR